MPPASEHGTVVGENDLVKENLFSPSTVEATF